MLLDINGRPCEGRICLPTKGVGKFSRGGLKGNGVVINFDPDVGVTYCNADMEDLFIEEKGDPFSFHRTTLKTGQGSEFTSDAEPTDVKENHNFYVLTYTGNYKEGTYVNGEIQIAAVRKECVLTLNKKKKNIKSIQFKNIKGK